MKTHAWHLALAALMALPGGARAHDTWLASATGDTRPGSTAFAMASSSRFPVAEVAPEATSLMRHACVSVDGRRQRLVPERSEAQALLLRVRHAAESAPLACWIEQRSFDIELEAPKVEAYLQEVRAPHAVRAHWEQLKTAGRPWRETYRKNLRIETAQGHAAGAAQREAARQPVGLPLEIVLQGDAPLRPGQELRFVALLGGRPLAGLPVELVNDQTSAGTWRTSDAQGALSFGFPFAAHWLLRATWLTPRVGDPNRWDSEFVTLLLEIR